MRTQVAALPAIQTAVWDYFAGERREMILILVTALAVTVLALWLYISTQAEFALAFMITVVLFAGLMSAGIVSLMIRDRASSRVLSRTMQSEHHATVIAGEKARIGVVLSKYKYYRYGSAVFAMLALGGLILSDREWVHGVAMGLFLVVLAQILIDHYSEKRAQIYFERLAAR